MIMEMRPACKALKEMNVTVSSRAVKLAGGTDMEIKTKSFHCCQCRSFVRSEEIDLVQDFPDK